MRVIDATTIAAISASAPTVNSHFTEADERAHLVRFQVLSERADLFLAAGFTPFEVFSSCYYWFMRLVSLRHARHGEDAGLEQQAFQLLEYPHPSCEADWNAISRLHDRAFSEGAAENAVGNQ